jgi:glycosyltransferase involved in cell wall biosynthesis
MRIAYFAEIFPSRSETWVHHEIRELQRLGCLVRVYATCPRPSIIPDELRDLTEVTSYLREIPFPLNWGVLKKIKKLTRLSLIKECLFDLRDQRKTAQIIRDIFYSAVLFPYVTDFHPDFLFAHFAGTRSNLAMLISFLSGVPFGFQMHAGDVFARPALFRLKIEKAAWLGTISNFNIQYMREHYKDVSMSRFVSHSCGLPLDEYTFQPNAKSKKPPLILSIGRLVRIKGFSDLIKAGWILNRNGSRVGIDIIGDGPQRSALEILAKRLDMSGAVRLRGYCSPNEVRKSLLEASVFVMASAWDPILNTADGIPVALLEAMALGIPVISTRTSGIPELITHGVNGFLANPADPLDLAVQIQSALAQPESDRNEMLRAARQKIETNHDICQNTWNLLKAFNAITNGARPRET